MHLISFVGYVIGLSGKKYNYVVISKDKDYDNIIGFWKGKCEISIKRQAAINVSSVKTPVPNITATDDNQNIPAKEKLPVSAKIDNVKTVNDSQVEEVKKSGEQNELPPSDIEQSVEKLILDSGYQQDLAEKVKKVVSDGIKEEMALSSIYLNLKNATEDFRAIYELIKPLVKKHLKTVAQKKDGAVQNSSGEPSIKEQVQKILCEKNYSEDIFTSVTSIVCKNHKEKNAKMLVYRALVSKYGQASGLELYHHIKPLL